VIVPFDNLGSLGVSRDAYAHELAPAAWSDVRNARFRDQFVGKTLGHAAVYGTPTVAPYGIFPYSTATARVWIYGGLAKLYTANAAGTQTNITRQSTGVDVDYAATAAKRWNGCVVAGVAYLNNGVDEPQIWTGTGRAANFSATLSSAGWPSTTTCRSLRAFKNHVIALNVNKNGTAYPHMVKWSHPADPGAAIDNFDHTDVTQDAGEFDLADNPTVVVDGATLGEQFIVYKEGAYYAMSYIGPPYIFSVQKISEAQGMLAHSCAAEFPGGHCVLGQGDVYIHSGGPPTSILDGRMRKWLVKNIDTANYDRCWVAANPVASEIWVGLVVPGSTSATTALIWNWRGNTVTLRDLPSVAYANTGIVDYSATDPWAGDTEVWNDDTDAWNSAEYSTTASRLVMASAANTAIYLEGVGETFAGTALTCQITRERLSLDDPAAVKLVRGIRPLIEAANGTVVNVYVGSAMDQIADTTWQGPFPFTVGSDQKIDCLVSGRFISVRFESTSTYAWRMKRYDMDVETVSYF